MTHKERAKEVRKILSMTPDEVIKAAKGPSAAPPMSLVCRGGKVF